MTSSRASGATPDAELTRVSALAAGPPSAVADTLDGLTALRGLRSHLDEVEAALIDAARAGGASWASIATALGLRSRQAAEQRRLRLPGGSGDAGRPGTAGARRGRVRQREVDDAYGAEVGRLRTAVAGAHRCLLSPDVPDDPKVGLARATLDLARYAEPGALVSLSIQAWADLDALPATEHSGLVAEARRRLRSAVEAVRRAG